YAQTYLEHGSKSLANEIADGLVVVITSSSKDELFFKVTEDVEDEFDGDGEIQQLRSEILKLPLRKGVKTIFLKSTEKENKLSDRIELQLKQFALDRDWMNLLPMIDNDLLEVYVHKLKSGDWIKVGRSSESREEH